MAQAFDYCAQLVRDGDKDRFLATLFASAERRPALHALYAFDLEISGISQRVRDPFAGEMRLQWWREVIAGGRPGEAAASPIAAALAETLSKTQPPLVLLPDFLDAHAFDLHNDQMATLGVLQRYARNTTGAIMELAALTLGVTRNSTLQTLCAEAGAAMTIANILRNFARHAVRGQLFVPADVLARHAANSADIVDGRTTPALLGALAELRAEARTHLERLLVPLAEMPASVRPAFLPVTLVPLYLARMERPDYDPFKTMVEVPQWQRQWRLWRAARA